MVHDGNHFRDMYDDWRGEVRGRDIGCLQVSVFGDGWLWIHKPDNF